METPTVGLATPSVHIGFVGMSFFSSSLEVVVLQRNTNISNTLGACACVVRHTISQVNQISLTMEKKLFHLFVYERLIQNALEMSPWLLTEIK